MYCKNCGAELSGNAEICIKCGFRKNVGEDFCPNCGKEVKKMQSLCVNCGFILDDELKPKKEKNFKTLNFLNPQTDLEKLIRFYLEGVSHPALKKPNNNALLNRAVQNDIPHFQTILANCDDLRQAQECVKKYVSEAKGQYSMFYLAGMINSVRQEVESRENRRK